MNKGKILKITENTVYIGYEDGSLKEIPIESCDFEPSIGDVIEIYEDIIVKVGNTDENNTQITNTFKKVQLNINKEKLISFLLVGFLVILASIFILSYGPKQDSKQKNTTSSSITQSNEDDTEKATADFNNYLEQNLGEKINYKGHITLINDDEIYIKNFYKDSIDTVMLYTYKGEQYYIDIYLDGRRNTTPNAVEEAQKEYYNRMLKECFPLYE